MTILTGLPGGPAYRPYVEPTIVGVEQSSKFRPLGNGERGVILWAGLQINENGWTMSGRPLEPQELRSALLLWDRLDWPTNDFLSIASGPDEQFLIDEGVFRRTRFKTHPADAFTQIVKSNVIALAEAEAQEPGKWSLSRGPETASPITDPRFAGKSVLVRLMECVPVPHREVPLSDILEFKLRRNDELHGLRYHLERIYHSVLAAPDRAMAEDSELNALDRAMAAHVRALQEAPFRKALSSLEASLDLPTIASAVASSVTAFMAGLPVTSALLTGAGALSVSLGLGRAKQGQPANPFEYVTLAHKEL